MDDHLQELVKLQREQNELLKKYLWRIRFSLMGLFLLTTATAIGMGVIAYQNRPKTPVPLTPPTFTFPTAPTVQPAPAGDIELDGDIPGTT
jgi:hypothetical protein